MFVFDECAGIFIGISECHGIVCGRLHDVENPTMDIKVRRKRIVVAGVLFGGGVFASFDHVAILIHDGISVIVQAAGVI